MLGMACVKFYRAQNAANHPSSRVCNFKAPLVTSIIKLKRKVLGRNLRKKRSQSPPPPPPPPQGNAQENATELIISRKF